MKKAQTALEFERHKDGILLDARSPGLRLHASGARRSWIYRYRLHTGHLRQMKLGDYGRMTLAEAREEWAQQKKIRDAVKDPREERRKVVEAQVLKIQAAYSVADMVGEWIELHAAGLKRGAEMERLLRREVLGAWKNRSAASVTRRDCVDLYEKVAKRAPRVAEQMMSAVRGAYRLALDRSRINMVANPAIGVGSMKRAKLRPALQGEDLKALLAWMESGGVSGNVRDVMRLTLLTGCRSGEACSAEWSEVDLEAGVWTQPASKTKNGREHKVMLSRQARALLENRKGNHGKWLFPSRGNRALLQKAVGFAQWEARQTDDCPVKGWTVHDLRRTALTGLAVLRCPRVVQDRIANHADRSIAAIYDRHDYDVEALDYLQRWADHLDRLAARPESIVAAPLPMAA